MGWETRQRGGHYYTRSRKLGGRVIREYLGIGPVAEAIAAQDAADRQARAEERTRLLTAPAAQAPAFDALAEWSALLDVLVAAHLVAAGYHRHHRGEWRRRRHGAQPTGH